MGMLYFVELPFLVYGLYLFVKEKTKSSIFILAWLLLSPVPAAPGNVAPHAIRSLTMVVALEVIIAYACLKVYDQIKWKKVYITAILLAFSISLLVYLHNYYRHYSKDEASWWQYGYLPAVLRTEELKNSYDRIIIDPSVEQAYIFWLFGSKYDPQSYQRNGTKEHFDKYYFGKIQTLNPKDLLVTANSLPPDFEITGSINFPNGEKNILIGHPK